MKTVNLEEIYAKHRQLWYDNLSPYNIYSDADEYRINAMREACNQTLELAAEEQAKYYSELGFTNTGKKINDSILNLKQQII
jgi:hypothetical protein